MLPSLDEEQLRRRRRMMKTLKENAAEEESSIFAANSASSMLGWLYGGLLCILVTSCLFATLWLKPFLLQKFLRVFQTSKPVRLIGVFPCGISPSKHLPIIVPPNLALATAENIRDRKAIQFIQGQKNKLSSRKQQYNWNVVEMELELSHQGGFLKKDPTTPWIPSISEFSSWSRKRQVDFVEWHHLLNAQDVDGILEYGTVHFKSRSLLQSPINIVVEIMDQQEKDTKKRRKLLSALMFLDKHEHDKRKVFAQSVLKWIVQIENEDNYQAALEEYMYELFEPYLSNWLIGECRYSTLDDKGWKQWARYCPKNHPDDCCEIYLNRSSLNYSNLRRL